MRQIDQKINELKDSDFDRLTTPCAVFMTFETEEGYNRALEMEKTCKDNPDLQHLMVWLEKHKFEIKAAAEPSDIIWENRHVTPLQRTKKAILVWTILILVLFANSIALFILTSISNRIVDKFPYIDCKTLQGYQDPTYMEKEAIYEFVANKYLEERGVEVRYAGYTQCFCDAREIEGDLPTQEYGDDQ